MAFQPVPGCAEVACRFSSNDVIVTMTFYGSLDVTYGQTEITELATVMDDWAGNTYMPTVSNQLSYVSTVARGLQNLNDYIAEANTEAGVGSISGNLLPNNVSFAVKRSSGLTGRSARGRVYLVGLYSGVLGSNENLVLSTAVNPIVAALNQVRVAMFTVGWEEVIVSRYSENAVRPSGVHFGVDLYSYTDLRVDSRRDRLP